jgi:hypothetical protein
LTPQNAQPQLQQFRVAQLPHFNFHKSHNEKDRKRGERREDVGLGRPNPGPIGAGAQLTLAVVSVRAVGEKEDIAADFTIDNDVSWVTV